MGIVRKLWVMVVPFGREKKSEAVVMFNIMVIMSRPSEALRLIRLKFYGTLARRGEHVASKSSPNQQPVRGFWRNQKTHTLSKSKLGSIEKKIILCVTLSALGLPTIAQLPGLERHLTGRIMETISSTHKRQTANPRRIETKEEVEKCYVNRRTGNSCTIESWRAFFLHLLTFWKFHLIAIKRKPWPLRNQLSYSNCSTFFQLAKCLDLRQTFFSNSPEPSVTSVDNRGCLRT